MSPRSSLISPALFDYVAAHAPEPDDVLRDLAADTAAMGRVASMAISPDQGAFMGLLARLVGVRFAVEVGTFTGYSSICIARALGPGGRLLCCDVSEEYTDIARKYWDRAGVADRIELRIAPALETLSALPADEAIDFAFIDADKTGYLGYWEQIVPRLRSGGLILVDNTLWSGQVVDPADTSDDTVALRAFNDRVSADDRMESVLLPLADGLTVARKL
ncbi:O-methyltransferase [Sporichthya sp.]|uniref:O-methyltransferase n=1 Tax=Sporichthya sp. TaxID=65475 RepID=UPI00182EFA13|nr:O-methyltransferase [Sporichthya sp.]MBA3744810.1 class I SAM-dependent methyltransferase [Sporichthya sp.]